METAQTKKCSHCQTDIPLKAKKCPTCHADLRSWFRRHPILTAIGVFILLNLFVSSFARRAKETALESAPIISSVAQSEEIKKQPSLTENEEAASQEELLELLDFRCYTEYDFFHIVGEVKNISNKSLKGIVAVGNAYTKADKFVKSGEALIAYNPILPGQISPFEVLMSGNPEIERCKVEFKEFWGGTIPTKR